MSAFLSGSHPAKEQPSNNNLYILRGPVFLHPYRAKPQSEPVRGALRVMTSGMHGPQQVKQAFSQAKQSKKYSYRQLVLEPAASSESLLSSPKHVAPSNRLSPSFLGTQPKPNRKHTPPKPKPRLNHHNLRSLPHCKIASIGVLFRLVWAKKEETHIAGTCSDGLFVPFAREAHLFVSPKVSPNRETHRFFTKRRPIAGRRSVRCWWPRAWGSWMRR